MAAMGAFGIGGQQRGRRRRRTLLHLDDLGRGGRLLGGAAEAGEEDRGDRREGDDDHGYVCGRRPRALLLAARAVVVVVRGRGAAELDLGAVRVERAVRARPSFGPSARGLRCRAASSSAASTWLAPSGPQHRPSPMRPFFFFKSPGLLFNCSGVGSNAGCLRAAQQTLDRGDSRAVRGEPRRAQARTATRASAAPCP